MTIPNYKQRLDLFRKSKKINQKNYKWRYTVIPSDWLAQMGFYFDPIEQKNTDLILKDAINCIYCHRHTFNLKHCRSKSKDKLETISNVLLQHLNGDNLNCPISYLRLKIIKDFKYSLGTSNWSNDPIFSDPFNLITRNIFRTSFLDLNSSQNWNKDKINDLINAGLIHFDLSFNAFDKNDYIIDTPVTSSPPFFSVSSSTYDIVFCIYCKNIIRLSFNDTLKPIERHFLACHNGHCYFFKKLIQAFPDFKDLKNIHEFNIVDETEPTNSMDSIIHNSLLYENLSKNDDIITDSKNEETNNVQINTELIHEQINKAEEPRSPKDSQNSIELHSHNMNEDTVGPNSDRENDIGSPEALTEHEYDSSSKSQSIEENDPTYQDDTNTEDENEEKIYRKIDKKPILVTSPNNNNKKKKNVSHLDDSKPIPHDQMKETINPSMTSMKKRKKLLGQSPQRIVLTTDATFNDEISSERSTNLSKDKDLILNFTDHVNRKKDITRTNKILDDSADDFSFSNNGPHLFQLSPLKIFDSPTSKKQLTSNKQYTLPITTSETKDGLSNNDIALQTTTDPDKEDVLDDNKSSSVNSEVHDIDNDIQLPTDQSTIAGQNQHNTSLIHDDKEQYTKPTNQEEKDQILLETIHNNKATILSPTDLSNENTGIESTNKVVEDSKNIIIQKDNSINMHKISPKITNENKSKKDSETSFKRFREELVDQQLSTTKRKKNFDVSNVSDEKDNKPKHDDNNPVGRILSGASMVTKIPNTIINKDTMKEKLANVQKNNDFLTSSSSITEESDHHLPSPGKNITPSSLLAQKKELSHRRLRHA